MNVKETGPTNDMFDEGSEVQLPDIVITSAAVPNEENDLFDFYEDDVREEDHLENENDDDDNVPLSKFLHTQSTPVKTSVHIISLEESKKKRLKNLTPVKKIKKVSHVKKVIAKKTPLKKNVKKKALVC